jgi:hypothetical protein
MLKLTEILTEGFYAVFCLLNIIYVVDCPVAQRYFIFSLILLLGIERQQRIA